LPIGASEGAVHLYFERFSTLAFSRNSQAWYPPLHCHETSINDSFSLRYAQLLSILTITFTFQLSSNMSFYLISDITTVTGCINGRTFIYWSYRVKERMNLTVEPKLPLPSHKIHKSLGTGEGKSSFSLNSSCYRK